MLFAKKYFEQGAWILALLCMYFLHVADSLPSLCVFKLIGLAGCPGCGLGHAIHYTLHFNFVAAFHEHLLGIPATGAMLWQIFEPFFQTSKNQRYHGPISVNDAKRHSA